MQSANKCAPKPYGLWGICLLESPQNVETVLPVGKLFFSVLTPIILPVSSCIYRLFRF